MKRLLPLLTVVCVGACAGTVLSPRVTFAQEAEKAEKGDKPGPLDKPDSAKDAPEIHYPPPSVRWKILTAGVLISGAGWATAFSASRIWPEQTCVIDVIGPYYPGVAPRTPCASGPPGSTQLGIPFVGPWIALGRVATTASDEVTYPAAIVGLRIAAYIANGLVQAAGLGLIAEALAMKTEEPSGPKKSSPLALHYRGIEMTPLPLVTPAMTGFGVGGKF